MTSIVFKRKVCPTSCSFTFAVGNATCRCERPGPGPAPAPRPPLPWASEATATRVSQFRGAAQWACGGGTGEAQGRGRRPGPRAPSPRMAEGLPEQAAGISLWPVQGCICLSAPPPSPER